MGDPSWCLRSSQDGIKSMRNSFPEAFPVRIPLDIDFKQIFPLNFYLLRLQNYWKYIIKIVVLSSSRISNIVRKCWHFGSPKTFILSISNHPNFKKNRFQGKSKSTSIFRLQLWAIIWRFEAHLGRHRAQLGANLASKRRAPGRGSNGIFSTREAVARHFSPDIDFWTIFLWFMRPRNLDFGSILATRKFGDRPTSLHFGSFSDWFWC